MKNNAPLTPRPNSEKANTRFIFAGVANVLYIAPCIMCLAFGILSDGFSTPFIAAIATAVLAAPVSFIALYCYKQKKGRSLVLISAAVLLVCHIVTAVLITTWYLILAPSLVLTLILIAYSNVIEDH